MRRGWLCFGRNVWLLFYLVIVPVSFLASLGRRHGYLKVVRGFFLSGEGYLKGFVLFLYFRFSFARCGVGSKGGFSWVGFFWLGLVGFGLGVLGRKKLHYTGTLSPGLQFYFHSKAVLLFFLWVWHWSCLFSFQYGERFFPTVISAPHGRHFRSTVISWVVLSGNAHMVANSPIFFWDVIGSEWVIAIEF